MTVTVTGVDGQFRTSDEAAERPMQVRYDQKMAKYSRVAKQFEVYSCSFFSHWSNSWLVVSSKFSSKNKFDRS